MLGTGGGGGVVEDGGAVVGIVGSIGGRTPRGLLKIARWTF